MDMITECAREFRALLEVRYFFVVSKNRKTIDFELDFRETDFYHLCGLQHLKDIAIAKDKGKTLSLVEQGLITDDLLSKSSFYRDLSFNENSDIESRISEGRFLQQYLETDNIIRIFHLHNTKWITSQIRAEYVIKSKLKNSPTYVFIFLRKRDESNTYGIVSFFKMKNNDYGGDRLYWMLKKRRNTDGKETVLFRHPNFKEDGEDL